MILKYKNRDDVDMTQWDIDDDTGTLCHVVWPLKNSSLSEVMIKIECELNAWTEENIEGDCFYTYERIGGDKTGFGPHGYQETVFYFKRVEDAFLFKLTWG